MARFTPSEARVLSLSPRIDVLPVLHGSGDIAQEVRETLIGKHYDCLAVPLPPSLEDSVEQAVTRLPQISLVILPEPNRDENTTVSFVPVDPCQAVIMGIRVAMGEGIARAYIDREVERFEPTPFAGPDPYAVKSVSLPALAAATLPSLTAPLAGSQQAKRVAWMAFRLHELELDHESILCLCHFTDWPWLRASYQARAPYDVPEPIYERPVRCAVNRDSLYFVLGELPFLTELYERRRAEVRSDWNLAIDGVKELLIETRTRWIEQHRAEGASIPDWVTPQILQALLQYVRNLTLLERRLTPSLYSLVVAAKQTAGDDFAVMLLKTAKDYGYQVQEDWSRLESVTVGIDQMELPGGTLAVAKNRLPGAPLVWKSLSLRPKPDRRTSRKWSYLWNPQRQCSWPPEDQKIESFNTHVREQARALIGADLAKTEKFTTSMKDGLDLRESLRRWLGGRRPTGGTLGTNVGSLPHMDLYVREVPPARGNVEVVIFLFDTPADPQTYSWQATWFAEHQEESTLCFYATPFADDMVGPGIGQSRYGGALFLFPPRPIPDIWSDPNLAFATTLEERLIAAGAAHTREPHIAIVSPIPPRARWRWIARQYGRRLVTLPLTRFSSQTLDRLRRFHVLNGHEIRSYAARFIR
ncbi:hypothetical protein ACO9S2_16400 [Nitrospira sp. NS4]|uniref:hypothetical protein n=1 Tax=Nitrospira sp. NS4 TaxID=3414498 RepID=UPI003C2B85FB